MQADHEGSALDLDLGFFKAIDDVLNRQPAAVSQNFKNEFFDFVTAARSREADIRTALPIQ